MPHPADTITRRDFLEGVALTSGAFGAPLPALAALEGQTDALFAAAHRLRDGNAASGVAERDDGIEDLVVVGAGISGLAGALLFQQHAGRPVRVLMLDALDHAAIDEATRGARAAAAGEAAGLGDVSGAGPEGHWLGL